MDPAQLEMLSNFDPYPALQALPPQTVGNPVAQGYNQFDPSTYGGGAGQPAMSPWTGQGVTPGAPGAAPLDPRQLAMLQGMMPKVAPPQLFAPGTPRSGGQLNLTGGRPGPTPSLAALMQGRG